MHPLFLCTRSLLKSQPEPGIPSSLSQYSNVQRSVQGLLFSLRESAPKVGDSSVGNRSRPGGLAIAARRARARGSLLSQNVMVSRRVRCLPRRGDVSILRQERASCYGDQTSMTKRTGSPCRRQQELTAGAGCVFFRQPDAGSLCAWCTTCHAHLLKYHQSNKAIIRSSTKRIRYRYAESYSYLS
jgi:hypothetical protein